MKFKQYLEKKYEIIMYESAIIPLVETTQVIDIPVNFDVPMHNKKLKNKRFYRTDIAPKDRTLDNLPRYANKKIRCKFQDWLCFAKKNGKDIAGSYGRAANGKWYGWSHRAIYGFEPGFEVKSKDEVSRRRNKTLPYKIKDDADAKWHAIEFANQVA